MSFGRPSKDTQRVHHFYMPSGAGRYDEQPCSRSKQPSAPRSRDKRKLDGYNSFEDLLVTNGDMHVSYDSSISTPMFKRKTATSALIVIIRALQDYTLHLWARLSLQLYEHSEASGAIKHAQPNSAIRQNYHDKEDFPDVERNYFKMPIASILSRAPRSRQCGDSTSFDWLLSEPNVKAYFSAVKQPQRTRPHEDQGPSRYLQHITLSPYRPRNIMATIPEMYDNCPPPATTTMSDA